MGQTGLADGPPDPLDRPFDDRVPDENLAVSGRKVGIDGADRLAASVCTLLPPDPGDVEDRAIGEAFGQCRSDDPGFHFGGVRACIRDVIAVLLRD